MTMASKLSSAEDTCEGDDCEAITDLTYNVMEKNRLCNVCASKHAKDGCIGKARKVGPNLYCEKHGEEIKLYCKTHGVSLCYACASIDHNHQPCVRQDIEDAIMENKKKLNGLKEKAMDKLQLCRGYGDQIRQCRHATDKHLQALTHEVDSVINEVIKNDEDKEQEDAAKINEEVDAKIKKLQEKIHKIKEKIEQHIEERKERLDLNHNNAEKRRVPISNKQSDLHSDIVYIAGVTEKKIVESEKSWEDDTKTAENTVQTLTTALTDDRRAAEDGHRVNTSATEELKKPLDEDGVKYITRTVSDVRFVKGAGKEKYNGRIDGYDGEWRLIDTINVKDEFDRPVIVGCIDKNEVIITDLTEDGTHTYMLDMNTNNTRRVITMGETSSCVMSCALLNDDQLVCGRAMECTPGDSLPGYISVYDRQWNLINDVTMPRNTEYTGTWVTVAADQNGMIIAAENEQSKIYVINPADGKITNTITCKENIWMRGVLSSGHIIAKPCPAQDKEFIIDREGAQSEIPHSDVILNVCIDPIADDIYVVTSDDERKTCAIDQVMSGGEVKKRAVASMPLSTRLTKKGDGEAHLELSRVMMTSSGNIIACDGANILVFKKLFSL